MFAMTIAAMSVYAVIYSVSINPGQSKAFYSAHLKEIAPAVGVSVGVPISFALGWLFGRKRNLKAALTSVTILVGLFVAIDLTLIVAFGELRRVPLPPLLLTYVTYLAAAMLGAFGSVARD